MIKMLYLPMIFVLMIVLTAGVLAQNVGNGKVLTIKGATEFSLKAGDEIITKIETSRDNSYGMRKGFRYTQVKVRRANKIIYFYYAADTPEFQNILNDKTTKISTVCAKQRPLKKDDKFTIQLQPAKGSGTIVTFTFAGPCFSFFVE